MWEAVVANAKPGFRTNTMRRRKVEMAIAEALEGSEFMVADIYGIVEHQGEFE